MRLPLIGLLVLGFVFTACAPRAFVRGNVSTQSIISDFQADRGSGSTYKIGEPVSFGFNVNRNGFVTLITSDSDTTTYELDRNIPVKIGKNVLPPKGANFFYRIKQPTGTQRVYLIFSDTVSRGVKFEGKLESDSLEAKIQEFFNAAGSKVRDVIESSFEVINP
jgi:Domain of unknown function (DUF4384)